MWHDRHCLHQWPGIYSKWNSPHTPPTDVERFKHFSSYIASGRWCYASIEYKMHTFLLKTVTILSTSINWISCPSANVDFAIYLQMLRKPAFVFWLVFKFAHHVESSTISSQFYTSRYDIMTAQSGHDVGLFPYPACRWLRSKLPSIVCTYFTWSGNE